MVSSCWSPSFGYPFYRLRRRFRRERRILENHGLEFNSSFVSLGFASVQPVFWVLSAALLSIIHQSVLLAKLSLNVLAILISVSFIIGETAYGLFGPIFNVLREGLGVIDVVGTSSTESRTQTIAQRTARRFCRVCNLPITIKRRIYEQLKAWTKTRPRRIDLLIC